MEADKEKRKAELFKMLQGVERKQPELISDQELLAQCQSKERQTARTAFNQLIRRYQDPVYTYVSQMLQDDPAAFEATRDVFVQAHQALAQIRPDLAVKAWLLTLAKRQTLKASRLRGAWYRALIPLSLYQWYLRRVERHTPPEAVAESAKTDCTDIRRLFSAYHDGELSAAETTRVATHLHGCEPCRLEFEQLLETAAITHALGMMSAPPHLQRAIQAAIEHAPLWERGWHALKQLTARVPFSAPSIAALAATMALIILGVVNQQQRQTIQNLTTQLRSPVRGIDTPDKAIEQNTFVIFTGKIVSEEMPLEAGEFVASLIPDPEKAPQPLFIPGNLTAVGDQVVTYLRSLQAKFTEETFQKKALTIRKITAELPRNTPALLARFLQTAARQSPAQPNVPDISTVLIEIYLIDQR